MDIEQYTFGQETFNWDLYDYLLVCPEHEVANHRDCMEKRFALSDRVILHRAKNILKTMQFRTVKLKLSHADYEMNRHWIDPLLEDMRTPLDGYPFESLTIYLDVKCPRTIS